MKDDVLTRILSAVLRERWAPLPTGPDSEFAWASSGYFVSNQGRVVFWSPGGARNAKKFVLKVSRVEKRPGKTPRPRTNLSAKFPPRYRTVRIHRLVAATFPVPGSGELVRHLDGNPWNNNPENLRFGTHSENLADQYRLGERGREEDNYETDPDLGF